MVLATTVIQRQILEAVRRAPGAQLDDLEESCSNLTWNQIFLEVDTLSRAGQLQITSMGHGAYSLMPARATTTA